MRESARARESEREGVCECVRERDSVCVFVRERGCVCVRERERERGSVCVRERERKRDRAYRPDEKTKTYSNEGEKKLPVTLITNPPDAVAGGSLSLL